MLTTRKRAVLEARIQPVGVVAILVTAGEHECLTEDVAAAIVIPELKVDLPLPIHRAEARALVHIRARAAIIGRALGGARHVGDQHVILFGQEVSAKVGSPF